MAKQYFNIPLGNLPALTEMQNLLRRKLPEGTVYNDPATFHLTLVFMEDDKGAELTFDQLANDLPIFGMGSDYIDVMETENGAAVVVMIDRSPQLSYLQSAVYYRAAAAGAKISQFSYPNRWRPHITLAQIPVAAMPTERPLNASVYLNSGLHMEARAFSRTGEGSFEPLSTWELRADMPVQEFLNKIAANMDSSNPHLQLQEQTEQRDGKTLIAVTAISEMKGGYPNIALPADIKVDEIQAKGFKFVTLPIGQVDAKSRNGRNYKKTAVEQLVAQVNQKRPEGGWGHIKDEDMGTSYGPPAIRWLAAMIDKNGTAWAKGLPLTQEAQEYFDLARLTNSRVGTSLHAWVTMEGDDVTELDLIKLDLADPARVGVPVTAAKPALSTEMHTDEGDPEAREAQGAQEQTSEVEAESSTQEPIVNTEQESEPVTDTNTNRVTELELERKDLKSEIAKLEAELKRLKDIAEDAADVREQWAIPVEADFVKTAKEFKEKFDDMAKEASELLMDAATAMVKEKVKVESARDLVMELVRAEKPLTRKALTRVIDDVLGRESIRKVLEVKVVEEMGGNQPAPQTPPVSPQTAAEKWLEPVAVQ